VTSIASGEFPGSPAPKGGQWRSGFPITLDLRLRPHRVPNGDQLVTGRVVRTFGVAELIVEVERADGANAYLIHSYVVPDPGMGATPVNPPAGR
jgi:hypothetical protein